MSHKIKEQEEEKMRDIHKGGRPPIERSSTFYLQLLHRYETHTTRQLAEIYDVSAPTICNWLKKAREVVIDGHTETETKSI
jgi:hypothetical protein